MENRASSDFFSPECHGSPSNCEHIYGWLFYARGQPDWMCGAIYAVVHQLSPLKFILNMKPFRGAGELTGRVICELFISSQHHLTAAAPAEESEDGHSSGVFCLCLPLACMVFPEFRMK